MKIGDLAERTGVSTRMLRYYEDQGLLHRERLGNGYRDYSEESIIRVHQIRELLMAGLSTETIEELVPCFVGSGAEFRPMAGPALAANLERELKRIEQRIQYQVPGPDYRGYLP